MEFNVDLIEVETLALVVTAIVGFWRLSWQVGQRSKDLDALIKKTTKNEERIEQHEKECVKREAATREAFAEGSTKMAILDERTGAMQRDLTEIKEDLKDLKK